MKKGSLLTMVLSRLSLYNRRYSVFDLIQVVFKQSRYSYMTITDLGPSSKPPFVHIVPCSHYYRRNHDITTKSIPS